MRFGEQRILRGFSERMYWRFFGAADPAHFLRYRYLRLSLTGLSPKRILDAGSGRADHTFWLARRFPEAQVVGIDVDGGRIESAQQSAAKLGISNVKFKLCGAESFDSEPFDYVISVDVLEHIEDRTAALRNLRRLCRGEAFFHIPTVRPKPVLLTKHMMRFHEWAAREHHELPTAELFTEQCRQSGFVIDRVMPTFGRYTGELACGLFMLDRLGAAGKAVVSLPCRALALCDRLPQKLRYAVAVICH